MLDVIVACFDHSVFRLEVHDFVIAFFQNPFNAVNLLFALINLRLFFLQRDLGLLMDLLLLGCNTIKLLAHVLDLLDLSVVNVCLSGNLLVLLLDLLSGFFVLLGHFPLCLLCLG